MIRIERRVPARSASAAGQPPAGHGGSARLFLTGTDRQPPVELSTSAETACRGNWGNGLRGDCLIWPAPEPAALMRHRQQSVHRSSRSIAGCTPPCCACTRWATSRRRTWECVRGRERICGICSATLAPILEDADQYSLSQQSPKPGESTRRWRAKPSRSLPGRLRCRRGVWGTRGCGNGQGTALGRCQDPA
jgi:hypothetical protein